MRQRNSNISLRPLRTNTYNPREKPTYDNAWRTIVRLTMLVGRGIVEVGETVWALRADLVTCIRNSLASLSEFRLVKRITYRYYIIIYYYYRLLKYYNNERSSSRVAIVVLLLSRIRPGRGVDGRRKRRRRTGRRHRCTTAMSGRRMRRDPVSCPRPRRLSAGPGSGRVRVLSSRLVRLGRNGRVQRCRPAVRRQLGVRQNGIPTIIYYSYYIIRYYISIIGPS